MLTADRKKLKLTDFGLAREETVTEMMTAETGTYRWMAPEVINTIFCINLKLVKLHTETKASKIFMLAVSFCYGFGLLVPFSKESDASAVNSAVVKGCLSSFFM